MALSYVLPLSPFHQNVITTFFLIHADHPVLAFLKNMRKIFLDLGICANYLQDLARTHVLEPALCLENAPGATPPTQIKNSVNLFFIRHCSSLLNIGIGLSFFVCKCSANWKPGILLFLSYWFYWINIANSFWVDFLVLIVNS